MLLHVRYIQEGSRPGDLLAALDAPWTWAALGAVAVGLAVVVLGPRLHLWAGFRRALDDALARDVVLVPWILRLSLGITTIGAGLQGYWILPHMDVAPRGAFALLLVAVGFALLVGLAVRVAAAVALVVLVAGLATRGPELLMASESAAAAIVLMAGAAGRPSLDAYLASALPHAPRPLARLARLRWLLGPSTRPVPGWAPRLLRIGLGLSFAAAGWLEKLHDPGPALALAVRLGLDQGLLTAEAVVLTIGVTEVLLGVLLAAGAATRPLAAVAFLVLTSTMFALPDDPVVAHVALWGTASAVFLLGDRHTAVRDPVPDYAGSAPGQ